MIEVELRAFISEEKYKELAEFFKSNAKLTDIQKQITSYFDCTEDLRLMETDQDYCQLWMKKGKIHDDSREEYIVKVDKEYKETLFKMFGALGYGIKIKWFRIRKNFEWNKIIVALDYTYGYGNILELEIAVDNEDEVENAKAQLKSIFDDLKIEVTDKKIFTEKFNDYQQNWREYTKEIDEREFLNK